MSIIAWFPRRRRRYYLISYNFKCGGGMAWSNGIISGPERLERATIGRIRDFLATQVKQDADSHIIISFIQPLEYCE